MSCHATSCHVMSRNVTLCHVTSRHGMSCHVTARLATSCHVMPRHVMSRRITSYHVMSRRVTSKREELSNTIFSCLLILAVGHLVASRHPNVSRFVLRHHLLPSCWLKIPCRPAKRAPSERLRLAKVVKPTYRLHTGARVNAALLTYLLTPKSRDGHTTNASLSTDLFHTQLI